ncbi:AI-2E family transporter [Lacisediminimonas sp.]|uniref:AI-2E family transporter n=1 Tax=Lacisediminimonas sp. TaxID=3060582 RepID=UPI00271E08C1|nr:AI-2E family transporter [Lacisediminimonas sp.]MDO8301049.1 AI-2E family transporter [Lacisediminimonas sp.]
MGKDMDKDTNPDTRAHYRDQANAQWSAWVSRPDSGSAPAPASNPDPLQAQVHPYPDPDASAAAAASAAGQSVESVPPPGPAAPAAGNLLTDTHPHDHTVAVRNVALGIIAAIAVLFALQWGQRFFIPLVFSIVASYTLNPVVVWLERVRIPRVVGAAVVLIGLIGGAGAVAYSLQDEFQSILVSMPKAAHQISHAITDNEDGSPTTIQQMQAAATEIETATNGAARPGGKRSAGSAADTSAGDSGARFRLKDWLWAGSLGALEFAGQATMAVFLIFFLLLSGDSFKRKLVKMMPLLSSKKITVRILDDINRSIQNYMFMLLVTNVLLSLMLWVVFRWLALENAGAWAVAAGWLHIIPYFGSLIISAATGLTAFVQFGSLSQGLLVAGASMAVATLVGTLITTWMTGRIAKMNPAAVFIGLLFWGWLWGVWGLLLGIPIIVIVRVISEHLEVMGPIAELLGE